MTRTWWDNDEILHQFRDWLTQTGEEIDALEETRNGTAVLIGEADDVSDPLPEIGLLQVVEALTALRQEVKLETRSSRGLKETVETALQGMDTAQRSFESVQPREQEAVRRVATPIVEDLVALDEALMRGEKAFASAHRQLTETGPQRLADAIEARFRSLSWWRRLLFRRWYRQMQQEMTEAIARSNEQEFSILQQGYALIRSRLERAMKQHSIERMDCLGQPVDPSRMTVVELVEVPDAAPETVVEVVRPGYLWQGRVIRFAEVRAVPSRHVFTRADYDLL
jgi:molecular chaperone GrpE